MKSITSNILRIVFSLVLVVGIVALAGFNSSTKDTSVANAEVIDTQYAPYNIDNENISVANNLLSTDNDHILGLLYDNNIILYCYTEGIDTDTIYRVILDSDLNIISQETLLNARVLSYCTIDEYIYLLVESNTNRLYKISYDYITYLRDTDARSIIKYNGDIGLIDNKTLEYQDKSYEFPFQVKDIQSISKYTCIIGDRDMILCEMQDELNIIYEFSDICSVKTYNLGETNLFSCLIDDETLVICSIDDDISYTVELPVSNLRDISILEHNNTIKINVFDDNMTTYTICHHGDILDTSVNTESQYIKVCDNYSISYTSAQNICLYTNNKQLIVNGGTAYNALYIAPIKVLIIESEANTLDYHYNLGGSDIFLYKIK